MFIETMILDFGWRDALAVAVILLAANGIAWLIEHPTKTLPSVTVMMEGYRLEWMQVFLTRQPRIFDAQILTSLRQGTAFLASTSILSIGGVLAMLGNLEAFNTVITGLSLPPVSGAAWTVKLGLVGGFLVSGFLRFVWANRLFGYCAAIMGSVPNDANAPGAKSRARLAGRVLNRAALNFSRGLRGLYFALAAVAWIMGPIALLLAALLTLYALWSREFRSQSHQFLTEDQRDDP